MRAMEYQTQAIYLDVLSSDLHLLGKTSVQYQLIF